MTAAPVLMAAAPAAPLPAPAPATGSGDEDPTKVGASGGEGGFQQAMSVASKAAGLSPVATGSGRAGKGGSRPSSHQGGPNAASSPASTPVDPAEGVAGVAGVVITGSLTRSPDSRAKSDSASVAAVGDPKTTSRVGGAISAEDDQDGQAVGESKTSDVGTSGTSSSHGSDGVASTGAEADASGGASPGSTGVAAGRFPHQLIPPATGSDHLDESVPSTAGSPPAAPAAPAVPASLAPAKPAAGSSNGPANLSGSGSGGAATGAVPGSGHEGKSSSGIAPAPSAHQSATGSTTATDPHPSPSAAPTSANVAGPASIQAAGRPSSPATVTSPAPSSPSSQVVTVVSPLRSSGEGTHQITLRLTPEDLGSVDATVTVRGGQVVVSLTADNPAAKQALAAALPQLRHELGTEGNPATVFVSDGSTESQNGPNQYSDTTHPTLTTDAEAPEEEPVAVTVATSGPHSVDIRL